MLQLLGGKCYHADTFLYHHREDHVFWNKALDGRVSREEWEEFLPGRGFSACADYPVSLFYRFEASLSYFNT